MVIELKYIEKLEEYNSLDGRIDFLTKKINEISNTVNSLIDAIRIIKGAL